MQLGMIGLGRMGSNMVQRLMKDDHICVVFDMNASAIKQLAKQGAIGSDSLKDFVSRLTKPRAIWLMVPAAVVDKERARADEARTAITNLEVQRGKVQALA